MQPVCLLNADGGQLNVTGDIAYTAEQFFDVSNTPRLEQDGYSLLSGHIDWESPDGRWNASFWGKNLTNKFYFTSRVDLLGGFGFDYNHLSSPRTYGVTVGTKF